MMRSDPDWAPTLNLGNDKKASDTDTSRYERRMKRRESVIACSTSESEAQNSSPITSENSIFITDNIMFDEIGIQCNIGLSSDDEMNFRSELNRLTQENVSLKEKLANKELRIESLKDHDETVKFFTGLTDYNTMLTIFTHVSSKMPVDKRRLLTNFQVFLLTFMHIRIGTPLQHLAFFFWLFKIVSL